MKADVLILAAGRAAQALLTVAGYRLMTTFLNPGEVGNYYLIASMVSLFGLFLLNPICMYINRKLFVWHDAKSIFAHFLGYNIYALLVSLLAFIVVWVAWQFFGIGAGLPGLMFALIVAAYVYLNNWNQNLIPALNALGHKVSFVLLTLLTTGLGLLLSVAFVLYLSRDAVSWMAGLVLATGIITVISSYLFRSKIKEPAAPFLGFSQYINKETLRAVLAFALPLAGATLFMWAQGQSYRITIEKINGAELLGYIAVGFSIAASVAGILESLVQQLYFPDYYRKISGGDKNARQEAFAELAAKAIPVYIVYLFFIVGSSQYLVNVLVAPKYHDVFVYARYGAFIEFFRMVTNVLASAAHSEMRTNVLIKPYITGGLCAMLTVYLAALSPNPRLFIPIALVLSGFVTVLAMRRAIIPILRPKIDRTALKEPFFFSMLFLVSVFIHPRSFYGSLGFLAAAVAYFAFLQYRVSRKWLGSGFAGGKPAPLAEENLSPTEQDV